MSPLDQAGNVQVEVWVVVIVTLQYGYGGALGFPSKGDGPLECVPLLGLGTGGELTQAKSFVFRRQIDEGCGVSWG